MQNNTNDTQIKLEHPFTAGARLIDTITLRRPKVADQLAAQRAGTTDIDAEIQLVANLSGLTPAEVGLVDCADYSEIQAVLKSFFSRRHKSSAK